MKKLLILTVIILSSMIFPSYAGQNEQIDNCDYVLGFIKNKKYDYITPNEEQIARRLYMPKIDRLIKDYLNRENTEIVGMFYADFANNGKPMLLAEMKVKDFCNYTYFVRVDEDGVNRLFFNSNRDYTKDFPDNYKLFCKGESVVSAISINGINYIVSSNHGGRINRIDRINVSDNKTETVNVCLF